MLTLYFSKSLNERYLYGGNMKKLFLLNFKRIVRNIFKNFGVKFSYLLLVLSATLLLLLVVPNFFNRVPAFSHFIETLELPLSYKLHGEIHLLDSDGNEIRQKAQINIGGYGIVSETGEQFLLEFSSPKTEYVFVTIVLEDSDGNEKIITKRIKTNSKTSLEEEVFIYV